MRLWAGQTISALGSQVSGLALPMTATLSLMATPFQMGLLTAAGKLPAVLFGLQAGVLTDRRRRRPLMIFADVGRVALLGLIPLAVLLGGLDIWLLVGVAFAAGILTLLFDVAQPAYLPTLLSRDRLVEGNAKLQMSHSLAMIAGPGLGGLIVQALGAPVAVLADAVSFGASALLLGRIETPEPAPARPEVETSVRQQVMEGLRLVRDDPILRAVTATLATFYLFTGVLEAAFMLYFTREVGISPGIIGLGLGVGSAGFLLGALTLPRVTRRFGHGGAMIRGLVITGIADLIFPLIGPGMAPALAAILLIVDQFIFGVGMAVFNINEVSLRQAVTPEPYYGRMNALVTFAIACGGPVGALLGGALGATVGLRLALVVGALGEAASVLWLVLSPVRRTSTLPEATG
jgi:MFS family permease